MKLNLPNLFVFVATASLTTSLPGRAAETSVAFTWPAHGQQVITLSGLAGTARAGTGTVAQVAFAINNQSIGQWWNGTNYQSPAAWLPASVAGTNWTPAPGVVLPALCCGQLYQLTAQVTDTATNIGTTNITVQADLIAPVAGFSPLASGQVVNDLSTIGGSVTDNFNAVSSVTFSVHELDINGGAGRWWNGTNFQAATCELRANVAGGQWLPAGGVALPVLNSGQPYELTVAATDTTSNSASATIYVTNVMTVLTWDPGATPLGTAVLTRPNTNGGNYWFKISPQSPAVGVWRTALNVPAGQAGVYLSQGSPPNIYSHQFASANPGSNGFVLDASQFNPGQEWFILVNASTNAQWNLVTGDAFVYQLGALAADGSSSTNAAIGAEGMLFCQTTISADTLAWQLWLNGAPNLMYVKKSAAPHPVSYQLTQAGQMLVVPPYLAGGTFNGSYFMGVVGSPGTVLNLDSRKQPVADLPFSSLTNILATATNFPYVTYRVQVPVQQIAWQLNLTPTGGNPAIAVRRDSVPNEFRNDAFSETPAGVGASISLVPPPPQSPPETPGLSDGTFYVTVYSTAPFACAFSNANPVITDVHYLFSITNDAPGRAGWRYYRVGTIAEQLGTLGWELLLAGQVPGTEIALRRNAVPGEWSRRNNDDDYFNWSLGYVDYSGTGGFLQRPGHQADIWYIGVYTPTQALGNFVLTGNQLTGQLTPFDGAGSSVSVANQPAGKWGFFRIDVPADALGWDVRLVGITNGNPRIVVSRDTLPSALNTTFQWSGTPFFWVPNTATNWPSGSQWLNSDWTGCATVPMLVIGLGNPLQAGTYYVGVQDQGAACSYTLQSRGIGLANYAIRVRDLNFSGSTNVTGLAVGEADYYRVTVPSNSPDWKLALSATTGEVSLKVQKDYLPNSGYGGYGQTWWPYQYANPGKGGQLMMKPGNEQWLLLPENGYNVFSEDRRDGTNVPPGTYYAVVVSQGQSLTNLDCNGSGSGWGSSSSSYTLSSGVEPVTLLPDTLNYGNDLLFTNTQAGGEMKLYQFAVPLGIASLEVRLEERTGNPIMFLTTGTAPAGVNYYGGPYGNSGGTNYQWTGGNLITVVNPAGAFSLSVYGSPDGSGSYTNAGYVLRVRAVPPPLVAFDGGTYTVTNQLAAQWQFFQVNVPAGALGWDVRLVGVTNGNPKLVVCRDALPTALNTTFAWSGSPFFWVPNTATNWPGGSQWVNSDWTGCGPVPVLAMGMGNPLEAGTYYLGVQDPNNASSYTLQSRGIGAGLAIPVRDLNPAAQTNGILAVAEGDYYRVIVPSNSPMWKLHLTATTGDVLLKVQKDFLPNSGYAGYGQTWWPYGYAESGYGGQLVIKPGDEQWALLPENGYNSIGQDRRDGANVPPGTYYALVVGQGQSLTNAGCSGAGSGWGLASSSYTLRSVIEPVTVLPDALSYTNDLLFTNTQAGGEVKLYRFAVPPGVASIELRLESRLGNPVMYLNSGSVPVGTIYHYPDMYGNYGGTNYQWTDGSLITVANPAADYSLSVYGSTDVSGDYEDAGYVLRVRAVPPPSVAFDGGTFTVTNQLPARWQFFQVNVPADALGWDIRLTGVTNGNPKLVVCRDALPTALNTTFVWSGSPWFWVPNTATNWPGGNQWLNSDWTSCATVPMLVLGMGTPLQPGTYYVGVQDPINTNSYTLLSRGIGLTNGSIRVHDLSITGSTNNPNLPVGEADYYRITVSSNTPDWKLHLNATTGDVLLKVQKDGVPNSGYAGYGQSWWPYGYAEAGYGGQLMLKPGNEQWVLLPENGYNVIGQTRADGTNVPPGTYYAVVVSQGQNLTNAGCSGAGSGWGSGNSSYTLSSAVEAVTVLPGPLSYGNDLSFTNTQAGGEMKFYQFTVQPGTPSIEVRLENRVGNPVLYLNNSALLVGIGYDSRSVYGNYGGTNYQWLDPNLITIPNVTPGLYSLSVHGSGDYTGDFADASYRLRVRAPVIPQLSLSPELNAGALTNVVSGVLADNQREFYQFTVPGSVAGAPVLGWKLDLNALNGSPSVRVRQYLLPDDAGNDGTSPFNTGGALIAPPYLSPGTWYVEVKGGGATTYLLTSSVITTNTLAHPLWVMPQPGQTNTAPGLVLPAIGDSGVGTNGNPLPGDQGIDLAQGEFDYYAVMIPTNNAGLLRTELQAISGDPNLYLRVGAAPTLSHYAAGNYDSTNYYSRNPLYERSLTGSATEYGNWVPLNGRYETRLTAGLWVLAVQAGGNGNARYRLQLGCGNSISNGLVQDLALNGGSFTNQNLNGGDWRYYRVQIPSNAPNNWTVTWSRSLGSARLFVRDTSPPGDGNYASDFSNPTYNPGPWYPGQNQDLESWAGDGKNQGPYPRFDSPGTVPLTTPPLRPGSVYYLGFWSPVDTTFAVSSTTSGGTIDVTNTIGFIGGSIAANLPAHATRRYRMDVPPGATRILFQASNSTDVVLSLEQGTVAQAGGPAQWTSYQNNSSQYPNQADASLNQFLGTPNNWPWLPGCSYYLTVTNTGSAAADMSFTTGVPADLTPLWFAATTNVISTHPNPTVEVAWGVTNRGPATAAGNWYDSIWLSTNGVLDANSVNVGNFWVNQTLPVGATYWQTNNVNLPMNASGSYTLFVQVDGGNLLYEASLANKVSAPVTGSFTLTPPDLRPVAVIAPAAVTLPNAAIPVAWIVTNQGSGAVASGWYDRVWFSTNGVLDGLSVNLGDFYFPQALAPGASQGQTNTVTLPVTNSGNYTLFVQADIYNWIFESSENNNISAPIPITLTSGNLLRLVGGGFTNGGFRIAVFGQIGQEYTLLATTNFVNWVSLFTFTCTNTPTYVVDAAAGSYSRRFYRVAQGNLVVPSTPIVLGFGPGQVWGTNGLNLTLDGPVGSSYTVEASTNLFEWLPITNFVSTNSPVYFHDPAASNFIHRFYRAHTP